MPQKEGYRMNVAAMQEMITIINKDCTLAQKRQMMRDADLQLSEKEQVAKAIIIELLSEYIMPVELNKPFHIYEQQEANEETYKTLADVLASSRYNYFNATCNELLWDHYHDIKYAEMAIQGYWQELLAPTFENDYSYFQAALGICRIYAKHQVPGFDFDVFCDNAINYLTGHIGKINHFGVTWLKALIRCGKPFEEIEEIVLGIITQLEESKNYDLAIAYVQLLEKQYSERKQTQKVQEARERIAKLYESSADAYDWQDPGIAHRIIHQIHNAMNTWGQIGNDLAQAERKRLAKRIAPVKKASLQAMQIFKSDPIDLTETVEHIKERINNSSIEDCIYGLAFIASLETPTTLKEHRKQSAALISDMFATTLIDQAGRKKCIVPAYQGASPEGKIHVLEYDASKRYAMLAQAFILRYLFFLREKGEVTEDLLRLILKDNAFVPEYRVESFVKGIAAGFRMDFITAIPILMPQIENAIRVLAENCGAVVYKTKTDGTEECLSFESILKLPEVIECLDEELLFNLRVFYTSDYGIGMRNNNGHGLLADSQLQSDSSVAAWWFALRLCCMFSQKFYISRLKRTADTQES